MSSRYPPQFKGIGLPRLISAAIPDLWEWKWWVSDRGKVPIKVHRVNAHCNNADFKSISALWLMQIGSNWARIALINVSKLSDGNVLPFDLNFVKLLFPLREWRQKLTSSMVRPKLCSTNTVENNHRHQHDIKHNASLSTRFLLYRSTKPKKGVRHTFNILV